MTIIEQIKAEIRRRIEENESWKDFHRSKGETTNFDDVKIVELQSLLSFLSTIESGKPMNQEGLEEEIEKTWLEYECYNEDYDKVAEMRWNEFTNVARHFAEWGADHTPLPEDTVLFNKGVEEGKRLMMEEAVKGQVIDDGGDFKLIVPALHTILKSLDDGDMVRIIAVKED